MASNTHYYSILGLTPGASKKEIKLAFKRLAFQFHPDRNPHNERAEEKFKEVVEAYSFLSGNQEAFQALQHGFKKGPQPSPEDVEDVFKILFDLEGVPAERRPHPLEAELILSLEDAYRGGEKKLRLHRNDLCSDCQGTGVEAGAKTFTCTYCFGEGEVFLQEGDGPRKECPKCNGRGFLSSKGCLTCRATGVVSKVWKWKVVLPPKVYDGQVLHFPNMGHEFGMGQRGDLFLLIRLKPHPRFSFDGQDIICETTIDLGDAALGGTVEIPTLNGITTLHIPPGTQSGQVLRLGGLGLGGDQLVRVWVKTPKAISEKERRFFQGLKERDGKISSGLWSRIKKWIW